MGDQTLSAVEGIKARSRHLRGTIAEGLLDRTTGALAEDDTQLIKFHGMYQQDDRDLRAERRDQRLEPAWQFMVRARLPGGLCTAAQWLAFDDIARRYANGTLRLTTRQAFQLHGVVKRVLKPTIAAINQALLDTLAACGDVNRNVMVTTLPGTRSAHAEAAALAVALSERFLPNAGAYHEIWLDGAPLAPDETVVEPIYGERYLPRKFKIAVAVPPDNDVDVYTQDLGFIAVIENGTLRGYNVVAGGGMGATHGDFATWPRTADVLGFCKPGDALALAEAVVTTQRDFGDRTNRRHARLKYTIEELGLPRFVQEIESRAGVALQAPREVRFDDTGDRAPGWHVDDQGLWHYLLHVTAGRVTDRDGWRALSGLRAIAASGYAGFRLTPNQNVLISDVAPIHKAALEALLREHGLLAAVSPLRRLALACVGLPTCGLAMAESERYAPEFLGKLEQLLARHGLSDAGIHVRITGCPNGCARPFVAEIALVGKAPGRYSVYLGGAHDGTRLNTPWQDNITEAEILAALGPLFERYAAERVAGERFGDFLHRTALIATVRSGREFAAAAKALAGG